MYKQNANHTIVIPLVGFFQEERTPKKPVVEEFEEFDYSDFYDDVSVSTVTAGPNVTEYEVRLLPRRVTVDQGCFFFCLLGPFRHPYSYNLCNVSVCWADHRV